jgi:hypothetical protein
VTESVQEGLAAADPTATVGPPVTGDAAIDEALLALGELDTALLPEHHDRLARAHEVLHSALEREDGPVEPG